MAHKKITPRQKRKVRVRKKVFGTTERPRLSVFRSNRYVYAQIIDDVAQATIVAANSLEQDKGSGKANAKTVGKLVAERALQKKVDQVVFDRNGFQYHGVIKEIAEAARAAGLKF